MGKHRKRGGGGRRGADGTVGYCSPPKEHQFKKGQSGNYRGRPKNVEETLKNIFERVFHGTFPINDQGERRVVTYLEALALALRSHGLKDPKIGLALIRLLAGLGGGAADDENDTAMEDERTVREFLVREARRLRLQQNEGSEDDEDPDEGEPHG